MSEGEESTVATPHECYRCGDPADLRFDADRWLCPDCYEEHTHTGGTPESVAETAEKSRERLAGCADAC